MNSFYGGKRGSSFLIVKSYATYNGMVADFQNGPSCTDVNFDEYVIINTTNKNNSQNGRVYRRGYDYNNEETGGALYVGTIVGPGGRAPMFTLTTMDEVEERSKSEPNTDGLGFEKRSGEGKYSTSKSIGEGEEEKEKVNVDLVPGKYVIKGETPEKDETYYNDTINWKWCSIRNEYDPDKEDNGDVDAYVGFQVPYTVFDFSTSHVDPYNDEKKYDDMTAARRVEDEKDFTLHPFYNQWHFDIPKGVKGDQIENFRLREGEDENGEDPDRAFTNKENKVTTNKNNKRQVLTYDIRNYDTFQDGVVSHLPLANYNMIEDIEFTEDGTINVDFTYEDGKTWDKWITWLTNFSLNDKDGNWSITTNTGDYQNQGQLRWPTTFKLDKTGLITVGYTTGDPTKANPDDLLRWITAVSVGEDGTLKVTYNEGQGDSTFNNKIKWIEAINVSEEGTLTVSYNNKSEDSEFPNQIKWIEAIDVSKDGTLTVSYNNKSGDSVFKKQIKWLENFNIADSGETSWKFNNETDPRTGPVLQYIKDIGVRGIDIEPAEGETADYHLIVTYNTVDGDKNNIKVDLGTTRDYSRLFTTVLDREDLSELNKEQGSPFENENLTDVYSITYLLNKSERFKDGATTGLVIYKDGETKQFFCYNFGGPNESGQGWSYVASFNNKTSYCGSALTEDGKIPDGATELTEGGIWFITESN